MPKFSKRSLENLRGVHPKMVQLMNEAIKDTPVDFTIVCGVRTVAQQQALYAQGRTAPGTEVTNCDGVRTKSNHQPHADGFGHAVDIYPYHHNMVQVNDVAGLQKIAPHIKACAARLGILIEWGGDWKMRDLPHFELK